MLVDDIGVVLFLIGAVSAPYFRMLTRDYSSSALYAALGPVSLLLPCQLGYDENFFRLYLQPHPYRNVASNPEQHGSYNSCVWYNQAYVAAYDLNAPGFDKDAVAVG